MDNTVKMKLTSMDVSEEKRVELKRCLGQAFPEVFEEGRIDFDQLKRVLGEWVDPGKERFGLNWPGKAECMKIIQQPSVATLKPMRGESVDFDKTENVFIEGDNLEVLKLLQKAYFGKVKMIYIDLQHGQRVHLSRQIRRKPGDLSCLYGPSGSRGKKALHQLRYFRALSLPMA
jgi:hypothetical protein